MAQTVEQKRKKRMRQLQQNIEAQIFMLDAPDDLMLLGTMYLASAKDIFLAQYSKSRTREVMMNYIMDVTEEVDVRNERPPSKMA